MGLHIRGVLILAQQWEVEQDGKRGGISSQDYDFADSPIEGLSSLVCAFLQLSVGVLADVSSDLIYLLPVVSGLLY
jgi:hypothetical protein